MKTIACTIVLLSLVAWANTSGVSKTGPDSYTISTSASPGIGGVPAAKRMAYDEAGAECHRRGLPELETVNETLKSPTWTDGMANVTLDFRCVAPGPTAKIR